MRRFLVLVMLLIGSADLLAEPPLRLGTNLWPGYEPLYLAAYRYRWSERLNVRMLEYPSASGVLRAFRNRTLEAAALTLDEVLMLREAGLPVRVVAVLDISHGGDVVLAHPEYSTFGDLAGARVGVESSALGAYVLSRALQLHDLKLEDLTVVHADFSEHEQAFLERRMDAVVTFEPVRTRLLAEGARLLFDSRQIPGEIVDVLVVHEDIIDERGDHLMMLIQDWFSALDYMRESPDAAAEFTARRLGISPSEVIASYDGLELPDVVENRRLLGGGLDATLTRLHGVLLTEQLLLGAVDTRDLLLVDFLPE